jgi:hypothetical protein
MVITETAVLLWVTALVKRPAREARAGFAERELRTCWSLLLDRSTRPDCM